MRLFLRTLIWLVFVCTAMRGAALLPARLPAEVFFQPPDCYRARLSPSGEKICAVTRRDDLGYLLKETVVATKATRTLANSPRGMDFIWKNEDLLLLLVDEKNGSRFFQSMDVATGAVNPLPDMRYYEYLELLQMLPTRKEEMLLRRQRINSNCFDLVLANVRTGLEEVTERDPIGNLLWFTTVDGDARAGWTYDAITGRGAFLWRKFNGQKWEQRRVPEDRAPDIEPVGIAPDQRRLIVRDYRRSSTAAISYYDPISEELEVLVEPRAVDPVIVSDPGNSREALVAVYEQATIERVFLTETSRELYGWLERALPNTRWNISSVAADGSRAVVFAHSDRNPGVYLLANLKDKKLSALGPVNRAIDPARTASSRYFECSSGDHLKLCGRVVLPVSDTPPPLVIILGPEVVANHSGLQWDAVAQLLASRGYAALRLSYRGTVGYGRDFESAGYRQITTGMVKDVEQAVEWLNGQGWIDRTKVGVLTIDRGGFVGFPLAAEPHFCRALATFNAPLNLNFYDEFWHARPPGGGKASGATHATQLERDVYAKTINPVEHARRLAIPSIHFSDLDAFGNVSEDARKIEAALKKAKSEYQMIYGPDSRLLEDKLVLWRERAKVYERFIEFFDGQFKAGATKS